MFKKKKFNFIFTSSLLIIILIIFLKIFDKNKPTTSEIKSENLEENSYNSNIISEVSFASKDVDGNIYNVSALEGEIDFSDSKIIYLKKINASVKLNNSTNISISSDFGKYNSENFNTIFSKNVIIKYLDNEIKAEYVDYSTEKNLMIVSKNVVYSNSNSSLEADMVEMNIVTKDIKIYMHENMKKIKIKGKN